MPVTSSNKLNDFYYPFRLNGNTSSLILSQIRTISSKRLLRKIAMIEEKNFNEVIRKIKHFLPGEP